jgi:hypothetical protein
MARAYTKSPSPATQAPDWSLAGSLLYPSLCCGSVYRCYLTATLLLWANAIRGLNKAVRRFHCFGNILARPSAFRPAPPQGGFSWKVGESAHSWKGRAANPPC